MDKITFESVMEEIKKSLGEARLMDIEEAMSDMMRSDIESGPGGMDAPKVKKQEEPKPPQDNSKAGMMTRDLQSGPGGMDAPKPAPKPEEPKPPQDNSKAGMMQRELGAGTGGMGTPTAKATTTAPGTQAPTTTSAAPVVKAPAVTKVPAPAAGAPKAPSAPRASAPAAVDTASIYKKHGVGSDSEDVGAFHRAEAEIAAAKKGNTGSTPSAPAAKAPSAPAAPRPQASAPKVSAPKVSAPAPSSNLSKIEPGSAAAGARDAATAKTPSAPAATRSITNTPSAGVNKGDNATQGTSPKGFGSSITHDALYRDSDKNTSTTPSMKFDPRAPSTSVTRNASAEIPGGIKATPNQSPTTKQDTGASDAENSPISSDTKNKMNIAQMRRQPQQVSLPENFDQFVKKFLKESR